MKIFILKLQLRYSPPYLQFIGKLNSDFIAFPICLSMVLVGGCSITHLPSEVQRSVYNAESGINSVDKKLGAAKTIQNDNFIKHSNGVYFGDQAIIQNNADFLPPIFGSQFQFDKQFIDLRSIASSLTDLTRIPTLVDLSYPDNSSSICNNIRVTQQDGSLTDLLNNIAARCDIGWLYRDGKILLSDTETKVWPVKGIPGEVEVQNQVNNNIGVSGQSGSSGASIGSGGSSVSSAQSQASTNMATTQNIAFNLQNSLWQNLQDAIKSMLSNHGKLSISPSTSSLTVTDKPSVLMRVDQYMIAQNDILKRQVQIDIQILNVDVEKEDNYGINWGVVLKGMDAGLLVNGQAVSQGSSGTGTSFVPSAVFVPSNTTQAFVVSANSGELNGSKLIINALSSINKTSLVTSTAVTTLSNQPVPVQFVDQLSYLASVQTTISGTSSIAQTSLTPGQLTTGFSLNVLPVIETDGKVNLQLSLSLAALKNMAQYTSNGSSLQLPETLQRNFMQKVMLRSGDTFVVTGFDSDLNVLKNNGIGSAYNWFLGGGVSANNTRTRLVVLVTPRVIS